MNAISLQGSFLFLVPVGSAIVTVTECQFISGKN